LSKQKAQDWLVAHWLQVFGVSCAVVMVFGKSFVRIAGERGWALTYGGMNVALNWGNGVSEFYVSIIDFG